MRHFICIAAGNRTKNLKIVPRRRNTGSNFCVAVILSEANVASATRLARVFFDVRRKIRKGNKAAGGSGESYSPVKEVGVM